MRESYALYAGSCPPVVSTLTGLGADRLQYVRP